jgi:pimeloyl-ACP methyl ester carboxylesterase
MTEQARDLLEKIVTLTNGLKIHYYEWPGPRPNLVLLHPSSHSHSDFRPQRRRSRLRRHGALRRGTRTWSSGSRPPRI